jgi:protein TonB
MPTETLPTRPETSSRESLSRGFALALTLHGLVAAALIGATWASYSQHHWGDRDPVTGSIQASMVSAIPLPPKVPTVDKSVLASDTPSVAPTPPPPTPETKARTSDVKPKAEPVPRPDAVPIPAKNNPPPAPTTPSPKATNGDAGVQIPMAVTQMRNGTSALTVDDRPFGDRYAYYIALVSRKVNQSKAEGDPDPPDSRGRRTIIRFVIQRDGTPTDISVDTRSGSPGLDTDTERAVQRIDSFGPLPAGDHLVIRYIYDSH